MSSTVWIAALLVPVFVAGFVAGQREQAWLVKKQEALIDKQAKMIDESLEETADKIAAIREFV